MDRKPLKTSLSVSSTAVCAIERANLQTALLTAELFNGTETAFSTYTLSCTLPFPVETSQKLLE